MTLTADDLATLLRLDFKPADLGDTDGEFLNRLEYICEAAVLRSGATDAQVEAGARYHLLSAQLRQVLRQPDMRRLGDAQESRGTAGRLSQLRLDIRAALLTSGLLPSTAPGMATSGSVPLTVEW